MNVYDFDNTIYDGDSTKDFYLFCLKKQPNIIFCIFHQGWSLFKYIFNFIEKDEFKEGFYIFLKKLKDTDKYINEFWDKNQTKIKPFYKKQQQKSDIIISASPEFLLKPICERLNIKHLIASLVDKNTGKLLSKNCYGEEKVPRFKEHFDTNNINEFYTDSSSDLPLTKLAKNSFMVKKDKIITWDEYKPSKLTKIKKMFFSKEFIAFLFVGVINTLNGIIFAYLYSIFMHPNVAFIVGYITSLTISYLLNSFLAFKESLAIKKYIKFCISYIPNFIIQNIVVLVIYNWLGLHKLIAYALAAILGIPITFIMIKLFAFKKKSTEK